MRTPRHLLTAGLIILNAIPAAAEIIGVEQFDYADGAVAGKNGGIFWDFANITLPAHDGSRSVWRNIVGTPAAAAGRLVTDDNSILRPHNGPSTGFGVGSDEEKGSVTDNPNRLQQVVYHRVSFTTGATLPTLLGLSTYDFASERILFGRRANQPFFGIETFNGFGAVNSTFPVAANTTYTLVAKVDYPANCVSLFINPNFGGAEPAATISLNGYTTNNFSTGVRLGSSTGGAVIWDDLVSATSWAELWGTTVTTLSDEDDGPTSLNEPADISLREAVKYSPAGSLITFAPGLNGQRCTLGLGEMVIDKALTIDASALAKGVTIDANRASRHFFIAGSTASLTLNSLSLTNGNGIGEGDNLGGAIFLFTGNLFLQRCTLSGNFAESGGAIWQQSSGTGRLDECTVSDNRAAGSSGCGGIVVIAGAFTLSHCTLSGNTGTGRGGALFLESPGSVSLNNCILAGNTDFSAHDIFRLSGTLTRSGVNLIGSNASVESVFSSGTLVGTQSAPRNPKLSPLGSYGGPVQTLHPLVGSLAINRAGPTDRDRTDARGFPRAMDGLGNMSTQPDIGAVEAGKLISVTTAVDEDNGPGGMGLSLREALAVSTGPGSRIGFTSQFYGTLNGTELVVPTTPGLFIDASNLATPITISGSGTSRVFNIPATATVAMHSLKILGGNAVGSDGGGILNAGTCTVIFSTLSGNSANFGGGINNSGTCTVLSSTFGGNSGIFFGGGIFNSGICTVRACTLSNNAAATGGGISTEGSFFLLASSIVAGNSASFRPDIDGFVAVGPNNFIGGDPLLAPLGDYGGRSQTMPPQPGSPVMDLGSVTTEQTDQRGFPRSRDGDGIGIPQPDIGAVEASLIAVTNNANAGPGSLRQGVLNAAAQPGADTVYFTSAVTGPTTLTSEIIISDTTGGVTIDANNRLTGQTLSGGNASRLFEVGMRNSLSLQGLTLTGGTTGGAGGAIFLPQIGTLALTRCILSDNSASTGGAIFNGGGTLTLTDCILPRNSATFGGAIFNSGPLMVTQCTFSDNSANNGGGAILIQGGTLPILTHCSFSGNSATFGGAISSVGAMTLTQCTFFGNSARNSGGAIFNQGASPMLTHCTLSGNSANLGGAIFNVDGLALTNTIVAGNSLIGAGSGADIQNESNLNSIGANIVQSLVDAGVGSVSGSGTIIIADPHLAPLANYGGPTQTMALRPGSPARNAGSSTAPALATDQRGFPMVGLPDIGAYEAGNALTTNYNAFIWETLPNTATAPQTSTTFDFDGDGQSNELEWLAGTGVVDPASAFRLSLIPDEGDLKINFPTITGRTYRLEHSTTLLGGSWSDSGLPAIMGNNALQNFIVTPGTGPTRNFYRVGISQP